MQKLRRLGVGGSALTPDTIELFRQLFTGTALRDGYAASEIGGPAIVWEIRGAAAPRTQHLFPNVSVYVLDEQHRPVPPGGVGELYVGGRHLARGYLRQPTLTAQRFLHDPFSDRPGDRMFRTGDLGRQLPDGALEIVGRVDEQVKIRGHRVNLRELDLRLEAHAQVVEAATTTFATAADQSLAAFIVARDREALTIRDLRTFLSRDLPPHMIPAAFMFVDRLPRTTTGKLDRHALPSPRVAPPDADGCVQPRNAVEAVLVTIWMEVLGVDHLGIHDSFLDLGGDSLLAVQSAARILDTLGIELPAEAIIQHPTIAELSEAFLAQAQQ